MSSELVEIALSGCLKHDCDVYHVSDNCKCYELDWEVAEQHRFQDGHIVQAITHPMSDFYCDFCQKNLYSFKKFIEHTNGKNHAKAVLSGVAPAFYLYCDICALRVTSDTALAQHKEMHCRDSQYGCKMCGKVFPSAAAEFQHMSTPAHAMTLERVENYRNRMSQ